MQVFAYARGWADLVVAQLAASHKTDDPVLWGYACLCVGRKFDDVIEKLYPEIDHVTGSYLHVFSLLPPPKEFLYEKIQALKLSSPSSKTILYAQNRLSALAHDKGMYYCYDRRQQIQERVNLLKDLQNAGLSADQYADFLFFDFRKNENDIEIDVIATKSTHLKEGESDYSYIDLFAKMGEKAENHFRKGDSVEAFVKDLSIEWDLKFSISKVLGIKKYIKEFIDKIS